MSQTPVERRERVAAEKVGQHRSERREADRVATCQGREAEILRERRLTDTCLGY